MLTAITRAVSPSLGDCELTYLPRQQIDVLKAREQHHAYEQCLTELGVRVIRLPVEPDMPDAVFVEDTAVVVDEVAVMTRPGAVSRQREVESVATALSAYRPLMFLRAPATLDGGDVMRIGRTLYVGATARTNREGIDQLRHLLKPYGYEVRIIKVRGCLHLKSGCSYVGRTTLLANRAWVEIGALEEFNVIDVHPTEPWAANALLIGDTVVFPSGFPQTRRLLEERGFHVRTVDVSELQKAEAGVTCMSIIFESTAGTFSGRER
ncbi:MAG: dimethylargininase [candidate division WOR-3 bacterium]